MSRYASTLFRHLSYTYIYTYIHTYIHVRMYVHTYIHTYVFTYVLTYIHTYIFTYIHMYDVRTYIRTYVRTYIRTYVHTYIHMSGQPLCLIYIHLNHTGKRLGQTFLESGKVGRPPKKKYHTIYPHSCLPCTRHDPKVWPHSENIFMPR